MVLAGLAMVTLAVVVLAFRLEPKTGYEFVLTVYVLGFAEIVGIVLALSLSRSIEAWLVLGCALLVTAIAVGPWFPPVRRKVSMRQVLVRLRGATSEPIVGALGAAVAVGLVYSAALGLLTPPNDWDAMTYHLARAAFWIQQEAVAYVPETHVVRINVNPPNAEIAALFTMLLSHGDRYVGFVQYTALLATAVGTYGISRRLGFDGRAALFGALLLLTTPVVILQASTALNDIVVASFLVAATYFLMGQTRRQFTLGGLALALAIGTKFTSLIALPLVALVVLAGQPRRRWPSVAVAFAGGVAAGSYWIVLNIAKTGSFDGGAGETLDQSADRSPLAILARWTRMVSNFADDMSLGRDLAVYVIAATAFLVLALIVERRRANGTWLFAVALFAVACLPVVVGYARQGLLFGHEQLWLALDEPDLAHLDENPARHPSSVFSYYGPLGFVLLLTGIGLVAREVRQRRLRPLVLLLAASPLVFATLVAFALSYDPWRGRFFIFPMALAATSWGIVLKWRWLAWGVTSIAVTTLFVSFVHYMEKPAGVPLFDRSSTGVWGKSREDVQTWLRPEPEGTGEVVKFFARQPLSGSVGLRLEEDDWVYPYFGRELRRKVYFVPVEANLDGLDWLVLRAGRVEEPGTEWTLAFESTDGWRVYRRTG